MTDYPPALRSTWRILTAVLPFVLIMYVIGYVNVRDSHLLVKCGGGWYDCDTIEAGRCDVATVEALELIYLPCCVVEPPVRRALGLTGQLPSLF